MEGPGSQLEPTLAQNASAIEQMCARCEAVTGAAAMVARTADWVVTGTGTGPLACNGHLGEMCLPTSPQDGHMM